MCCNLWVMRACHVWKEVIEPLCPLLVDMCKNQAICLYFGKILSFEKQERRMCWPSPAVHNTPPVFEYGLSARCWHGCTLSATPGRLLPRGRHKQSTASSVLPYEDKSVTDLGERGIFIWTLSTFFHKLCKQPQKIKNNSITLGSKLFQMSHS